MTIYRLQLNRPRTQQWLKLGIMIRRLVGAPGTFYLFISYYNVLMTIYRLQLNRSRITEMTTKKMTAKKRVNAGRAGVHRNHSDRAGVCRNEQDKQECTGMTLNEQE
jgi:hypothetical protein